MGRCEGGSGVRRGRAASMPAGSTIVASAAYTRGAARCRLAHPALWSSRMKRPLARAYIRLWYSAAVLIVAPLSLAAQQSVEADRALLAQERFVTPPPEVARLVPAARQQNSTLTQQSP